MRNDLHVVLGASGVIGQSVIEELNLRNLRVRAVTRTKPIDGVETVTADLLDMNQTLIALKEADYVYMCVGLPYITKIWEEQWPIIVANIIEGCHLVKAKLIFLDNIYMYGPTPLKVPFDESHSREPVSRKGSVRKQMLEMVLKADKENRIDAVVGRSADFYGPGVVNSPLYISFIERMVRGKRPQSLGKTNIQHTYAFSKDNGKALVELGLDPTCYGEEWHLPVSRPVTIDEITVEVNRMLGTEFKTSVIPRFMIKLMSQISPTIDAVEEMLYQADDVYIMSDQKFKNHFPDFETTLFEDGIREMVASFIGI